MINPNLIDETLKLSLLLQGTSESLKSEKTSIVDKVSKAKLWLSKEPEYVKFLQHLQNILHQKNIGAFSELLSYFVKDVLKKEKDIILDLYTYHNLPALKIEADNNGNRENIIEGNGGSIANIVSTGLRLIALSRLPNRKFIVLDEPDCWLRIDHIPIFAKIIGEISTQLNIQTVIISHHHWSYFKDYGRVIELKQEGPHLTTEIIHDSDAIIKNNTNYIKQVTLKHFMSHYNTTYELHPNLTCIVGENDIGKSVLSPAFKAIAYGDSSDSYIMHGENEAQFLVELSTKNSILWQRFREKDQENTQKVKFSLYDSNNKLVHSEFSAYETPDFIQRELNICTVEDIDVHIGNQKQPVFLLSSDTKPQQRAKILSLGKDSLNIQKTMEIIKSKKRHFKHTEKEGEQRFSTIEKQLGVLDNIEQLVSRSEELKDIGFLLEKQNQKLEELTLLIQQMELLTPITQSDKININSIVIPTINSVNELLFIISELDKNEDIANQTIINQNIEQINLFDTANLISAIKEIEYFDKISQIKNIHLLEKTDFNLKITEDLLDVIQNIHIWEKMGKLTTIDSSITLPSLKSDSENLFTLIQDLENNLKYIQDLEKNQNKIKEARQFLDNEFEKYFIEFGNICPTCHQNTTKEHLRGEHV